MVAAVAAIAVFSVAASALLAGREEALAIVQAESAQARAAAAADAGLALAIDGLLARDRENRWSIDGRVKQFRFADHDLVIRVEDERGKVPLNLLDEETAERLVEAAGTDGVSNASIAVDSLLDWIDDDDEPRPDGAESEYYAARHIRPRNSALESVDEVALIRGIGPAMAERMRPYVTVNFGSSGFDARFAHPIAVGVMLGGGSANPLVLSRQREVDGQREAIELAEDISLVGRPLTIDVLAEDSSGSRAHHRTIVELTGSSSRRYVVRSAN